MNRRLLASLIPAALLLAIPAHADIYAFTDEHGVRHLSNVPSDPRYKLVMRTPAYSRAAAQPSNSFAPLNLYGPGTTLLRQRNYYAGSMGRIGRIPRVNDSNRQRFTADINRIAAQYRLEPALMHAVISAESAYNPWAISNKGAMGLMQLMPGTAERFGVNNPYDPIANMHGGARYLRWLLDQFNDPRLAVAAYNAGEGAVQKYGNQVPPYQETQTYVGRVLNFYNQYRMGSLNTGASGTSLAMNGYTVGSISPSSYTNRNGNTIPSSYTRVNDSYQSTRVGSVTIISRRSPSNSGGAIPVNTFMQPTPGTIRSGVNMGVSQNSTVRPPVVYYADANRPATPAATKPVSNFQSIGDK
ncbi:MAG: lytic transglycosylase domain-containing protein [Candidatus Competibacteraceae bacterium]